MRDRKFLAEIDGLIATLPPQVVVPIRSNTRGKVPERVALATRYMNDRGYRLQESETQTIGSWNSFGHMVFARVGE